MYYITNGTGYYAGKCYSDKRTPVWKSHYTRAIPFDSIEAAKEVAEYDRIFYLGIAYMVED